MIDLITGIDLLPLNIEQIVTCSPPHFLEIKDHLVESAAGFPNMMNTLWGFICTFRRFPSQNEFMNHYLSCHRQFLRVFNENSVKARVLRAYPSLAREIHFYSLAKESGKFSSVTYSAYQDVKNGIDLMVGFGGRLYNVSCYVQTRRAMDYRYKKQTYRHKKVENSLELPLDLSSGKHINQWIFFDSSHLNRLQENIINYAWFHYHQHPLEAMCS